MTTTYIPHKQHQCECWKVTIREYSKLTNDNKLDNFARCKKDFRIKIIYCQFNGQNAFKINGTVISERENLIYIIILLPFKCIVEINVVQT